MSGMKAVLPTPGKGISDCNMRTTSHRQLRHLRQSGLFGCCVAFSHLSSRRQLHCLAVSLGEISTCPRCSVVTMHDAGAGVVTVQLCVHAQSASAACRRDRVTLLLFVAFGSQAAVLLLLAVVQPDHQAGGTHPVAHLSSALQWGQ